ncbi:hypothetical protein [Mesorhizobium sp. M0909]|uniref:hypothetical protein n=1 Tax=Mesorhizobium sp. M0909 TaxID=2957024 RepID=UPI0033355B4A
MATLRRGIGRLIDSYAEGVIDKAEFEPRIAGLKQRLSQLQERHRAAVEGPRTTRPLSPHQPSGRLLRQGDSRARRP